MKRIFCFVLLKQTNEKSNDNVSSIGSHVFVVLGFFKEPRIFDGKEGADSHDSPSQIIKDVQYPPWIPKARTWKWVFPFGSRPIFRGEMAVRKNQRVNLTTCAVASCQFVLRSNYKMLQDFVLKDFNTPTLTVSWFFGGLSISDALSRTQDHPQAILGSYCF